MWSPIQVKIKSGYSPLFFICFIMTSAKAYNVSKKLSSSKLFINSKNLSLLVISLSSYVIIIYEHMFFVKTQFNLFAVHLKTSLNRENREVCKIIYNFIRRFLKNLLNLLYNFRKNNAKRDRLCSLPPHE